MCHHPNCYFINIIEIEEDEKIAIHYNKRFNPIFIQHLNYKKDLFTSFVKSEDPQKILEEELELEVEVLD